MPKLARKMLIVYRESARGQSAPDQHPPFSFDGTPVRVTVRPDGPWFVLADVCRVLEIGNPSDAARRLDDDERGVDTVETPSAPQQMVIINESGLYSLILTSRKPSAKRFKKWVTSEVLPAIRKTGGYMVDPQPAPPPRPVHVGAEAVFLACLGRAKWMGWLVTDGRTSPRYAPRVFLRMHEARGLKIRDLEGAMGSLIAAGTVRVEEVRSAGRKLIKSIALAAPGTVPPPVLAGGSTPAALPTLASDLLEGAEGIAAFMGLKPRQVYHMQTRMPVFAIGGKLFARKSTLLQWVADMEHAALTNALRLPAPAGFDDEPT